MFKLNLNKNSKKILKLGVWAFALAGVILCGIWIFAQNMIGTYKVTLPHIDSSIGTLEYSIDNVPQGSTDGHNTISVPYGSKINFLLAINGEDKADYSTRKVNEVKIVPEGEELPLDFKKINSDGTPGSDPQPNETFGRSTYITPNFYVWSDKKFELTGMERNKYTTEIKLNNNGYKLSEAVNIKYQINNNDWKTVKCDNSSSFAIEEIYANDTLKLNINTTEAFSNSILNYTKNGIDLSDFTTGGKLQTEFAVKEPTTISIANAYKNKYHINSNIEGEIHYSDEKIIDFQSSVDSLPESGIDVEYGSALYFKIPTETGDYEVVNSYQNKNIALDKYKTSVFGQYEYYFIPDIKNNVTISRINRASCRYNISAKIESDKPISSEDISITPTNSANIDLTTSCESVNYGNTFNFKIKLSEKYQNPNNSNLKIYAIPKDEILNGNEYMKDDYLFGVADQYNIEFNNNSYTFDCKINSVKKSYLIVVVNPEINIHTISLPTNIANCTYNVSGWHPFEENNGQINYNVLYGDNFTITITADKGKTLSELRVTAQDKNNMSTTINGTFENNYSTGKYTIENVTKDLRIIVENIKDREYIINFPKELAYSTDPYSCIEHSMGYTIPDLTNLNNRQIKTTLPEINKEFYFIVMCPGYGYEKADNAPINLTCNKISSGNLSTVLHRPGSEYDPTDYTLNEKNNRFNGRLWKLNITRNDLLNNDNEDTGIINITAEGIQPTQHKVTVNLSSGLLDNQGSETITEITNFNNATHNESYTIDLTQLQIEDKPELLPNLLNKDYTVTTDDPQVNVQKKSDTNNPHTYTLNPITKDTTFTITPTNPIPEDKSIFNIAKKIHLCSNQTENIYSVDCEFNNGSVQETVDMSSKSEDYIVSPPSVTFDKDNTQNLTYTLKVNVNNYDTAKDIPNKLKVFSDSNFSNQITSGSSKIIDGYTISITVTDTTTTPQDKPPTPSLTLSITLSKRPQQYVQETEIFMYDNLYILEEFGSMYSDKTIDSTIHFTPITEGARYYDEQNNEITDFTQHLKAFDSQNNIVDEFKFKVVADEGYELPEDPVNIGPMGQITINDEGALVDKVTLIQKDGLYTITNAFVPDIYIYVKNPVKKTFTGTFNGVGTVFQNTFTDQIYMQDLDYNSDFTFYGLPQEGYRNDYENLELKIKDTTFKLAQPSENNDSISINIYEDENGNIVDSGGTKLISTLSATYNPTTQKTEYTLTNIKYNFTITINRQLKECSITFAAPPSLDSGTGTNSPAFNYNIITPSNYASTNISDTNYTIKVTYGDTVSFTISPQIGIDTYNATISKQKQITGENYEVINLVNGKYTIKSVTEDLQINYDNIESRENTVTFTQYDELSFKDSNGEILPQSKNVKYNDSIKFRVIVSDAYSNSIKQLKVYAEYASGENKELTRNDEGDDAYYYSLENVKENVRIYLENFSPNIYTVTLVPGDGIEYYNQYGTEKLTSSKQEVSYGENFSFKISSKEGYDISNLEVYDQSSETGAAQQQLLSANEVYTIENIKENHTITTQNISLKKYNIEFRVVNGGKCVDVSGNSIGSSQEVSYNDDFTFRLSLDSAYNKSNPTVTLKGSTKPLTPNPDGTYTIHNIKENTIVEVINITKNSYTAKFIPAEGVIFKTSKNKPFSGTQEVEYDSNLYFKISLLDAYDKSVPWVLLNGQKTLVENGGVYSLENIRDDVEVVVKNVVKNPEEITMDDVNNVPEEVSTENDIDAVIKATKTYENLSDEEKAQVTNLSQLKSAQYQSGEINHSSNGVSISGVDWNIKLVVTPLTDDKEQLENFSSKVDRRNALSLYEITLIDVLTGKNYEVPYGQSVTVTIPVPDLSGYTNAVVAHEKSTGSMEYLDLNIIENQAQFKTSSFSLFGIAAKKIPNFSENPSDMQISVSSLVNNEDELKSLLGEGLVSKLGNLIDESQEDNTNSDISTDSGKSSENNVDISGGNNSDSENNGSILSALSNAFKKITDKSTYDNIYKWAIDNEFISVLLILIIGATLIWMLIYLSHKKEKEEQKNNQK